MLTLKLFGSSAKDLLQRLTVKYINCLLPVIYKLHLGKVKKIETDIIYHFYNGLKYVLSAQTLTDPLVLIIIH